MYICFHAGAYGSGLANNGGTRTIVRSSKVIRKLGHKCDIVARHDKYKWDRHPKCVKRVPADADIMIAVSARDLKNTNRCCVQKNAWWMRGIETWQYREDPKSYASPAARENWLVERAKLMPIIVNATHLRTWLLKRGISSTVCFAGLDLKQWYEEPGLKPKKIRVGCLYHSRHKTKRWDRFEQLRRFYAFHDHRAPEFVAFGYGTPPNTDGLTEYLDNPSPDELRRLYSSCHVWFAPTESEGFHNVAAEAALCGALVICMDTPHNGMGDYCNDETAVLGYDLNDVEYAFENPPLERVKVMQEYLKDHIGSREKNMKKFMEIVESL